MFHEAESRPLSPLHAEENVASRDNSIIMEHIDSCTLHVAGEQKANLNRPVKQ